MPDTPRRLSGPVALTTTATTRYTVPASTTAILRSLHVVNGNAAARSFTLSIGADAAGTRLFDATEIPAYGVLDWSGFVVLAAAEIIQAFASTAGPVLTLSGIEVS